MVELLDDMLAKKKDINIGAWLGKFHFQMSNIHKSLFDKTHQKDIESVLWLYDCSVCICAVCVGVTHPCNFFFVFVTTIKAQTHTNKKKQKYLSLLSYQMYKLLSKNENCNMHYFVTQIRLHVPGKFSGNICFFIFLLVCVLW